MLKYVKKLLSKQKYFSATKGGKYNFFPFDSAHHIGIHCKLFSLKEIGDIPFQYLSDSM